MSTSRRPSSPSSRVRPRSHSRARGNQSALHPVPYLDEGANELLLPEGPASEEAVELLHEFVHPHHHRDKRRADTEATLVAEHEAPDTADTERDSSDSDGDEEEEDWEEALEKRPWYKRPSALWLLSTTPLSSIAMSACAAPRIEIYTLLACREHRPEYTVGDCPHNIGVNDNLLPAYHHEPSDTVPINDSQTPLLGFDTGLVGGEITIGTLGESHSSSKCASDPVVQAAAAKIIAVMTTTMGILSCLTTAFWGSLSDRYGRLRVLGISVTGLLFNDFIFIAVFFFSRKLPGGYWFLLLGPTVEGFLGGFTSMVAAIHAYIADVSSSGDRSRLFSLGAGLLFVGTAFGPSLGSLLVRVTRTPMAVFYMATAVHVLLALYIWIIVPESLPKRTQLLNRRRAEKRRLEEVRAEEQEALINDDERSWKLTCVRALTRTKGVFNFLSPLSVFAPVKVANKFTTKTHRDWSLTCIAASFGFSSFVMGSYQYKFQYAAATFGWTSEELGYWLSLVGGSRAIYLTLMLPLIIKFFNRPKQPVQLPVEPSEPLIHSEPRQLTVSESPSSSQPSTSSGPIQRSTSRQRQRSPSSSSSPHTLTPHTAVFDLRLARFSLGWEVISYTLIPLAPTAVIFSIFGCLAAWGGGFGPAIQALALETYVRRNAMAGEQSPEEEGSPYAKGKGKIRQGEVETGRLFGAMSVVQAMCSQIFGPTLFGITYAATVGTYPITIFWVSTICITLALFFTLLVRLPYGTPENHGVHIPGHVSPDSDSSRDPEEDLESAQRPLGARVELEREVTLVDVSDVGVDGKKETRQEEE